MYYDGSRMLDPQKNHTLDITMVNCTLSPSSKNKDHFVQLSSGVHVLAKVEQNEPFWI